jgi:hypothetical protein
MAYITKEKTAEIRTKLKKEFPEIKFSVRRETGSMYASLRVAIMKAPYEFIPQDALDEAGGTRDITFARTSWLDDSATGKIAKNILTRILDICNEGNYNNSRPEVDYFDVGWYCNITIGKWGQPFQLVK